MDKNYRQYNKRASMDSIEVPDVDKIKKLSDKKFKGSGVNRTADEIFDGEKFNKAGEFDRATKTYDDPTKHKEEDDEDDFLEDAAAMPAQAATGLSKGVKVGDSYVKRGKIIKTVGNVISNIIDAVKNIISALKGVVLFIAGVFTGDWKKAWQGVKKIFKGVWDALVDIAKTPINLIIGLINGLTGAVEDAINWIIDGINELSFTTPDWLPGDLGGQTFGFDLSQIDIPEIPKLAQGAVIPPNSEFLAVLGDQKRGTNIEAPLDTITQAVLQALVSYGGAGGNQKISVTIPLTLNGRTITQIVIDDINDYIKRNGRSPIRA